MVSTVVSVPEAPSRLLDLLTLHLPYSIPLLRRLQFDSSQRGAATTTARVLYTPASAAEAGPDAAEPPHFTAAYVDLAAGSETQVWIYSSLENGAQLAGDDRDTCVQQIADVVEEVRRMARDEPYRGRGYAKALATKILGESSQEYCRDGWCHADVAVDNASSAAVCTSLNGKQSWIVDWALLLV
ncbi:unnamed protein product [Parascedosporium putredinis]|uniref:Uncharacterized protein n=1 Tax=Parascedosporium putredinis TaxID=1442378 RepID=A0A9P1H0J5_9PEZI|nr:unnamed protein product [Parascedosporium putredinis]CAI7991824.1 unnamed protein product [Parascedosporium putredinis]